MSDTTLDSGISLKYTQNFYVFANELTYNRNVYYRSDCGLISRAAVELTLQQSYSAISSDPNNNCATASRFSVQLNLQMQYSSNPTKVQSAVFIVNNQLTEWDWATSLQGNVPHKIQSLSAHFSQPGDSLILGAYVNSSNHLIFTLGIIQAGSSTITTYCFDVTAALSSIAGSFAFFEGVPVGYNNQGGATFTPNSPSNPLILETVSVDNASASSLTNYLSTMNLVGSCQASPFNTFVCNNTSLGGITFEWSNLKESATSISGSDVLNTCADGQLSITDKFSVSVSKGP